jgi:hydroxyacylglutathione hydrolase
MTEIKSINRIKNEVVQANTFLIHLQRAESVVLVDPGSNVTEISSKILETGKDLSAILLTHGHFDHVMGAEVISRRFECGIYMSDKDASHQKHNAFYLSAFGRDYQYNDFTSVDFNELPISIKQEFEIIYTPGHSEGSVCILFGDSVFTGDTILSKKVFSRTVRGSSLERQRDSVVMLLSILKPEMWIYPGHGTPNSLGELLKINPELASLVTQEH